MKKSECDVCKEQCEPYAIRSLRDIYRTEQIEWVCPECGEELDNMLDEIQSLLRKQQCRIMKVFGRKRRAEIYAKRKDSSDH